jgi:glycosyltransferase involved in cell wall biosynthesis
MVMHSHGLGGIERHVLVLMQALARRGHRPHFAGPRDSWIGEQLARQGLPQVHVPMRGMYDLASGWRLQRYLRQVGADLVHGHAMRGTRYAVWGGARAGVTAVGSAHSTVNGRWLRGAEALFPVSMAVSRSLTTQGYRHHLSAPVYPGIPDPGAPSAERRAQQRRQLGIAADEQILGMIARFVDKKGHDVAVAALHRLRDLPVRLLLIGDHRTAVGDALRSQIQALDLQSRVLLVGQRDDAAALCSVFDVFLQPSRREPLGLTLLEAAAQERPIVASEVDGIPEVVLDGQTGLLVPPNDPERLAAATQRLLADPALAARLGRMARQHYLSRFTEDAMIERLLAGYRGVLRETRA